MSTATNPFRPDWAIGGPLTRVRVSGTDTAFPLDPEVRTLEIGTDEECAIRIVDPSRCVSRVHAMLRQTDGRWEVIDLQSKNGLYVDGIRVARQDLAPGTEIGLGGALTLIAESAGVIALRAALARFIGLGADSAGAVELSLRGVRSAAHRREVLVLAGEADPMDLVPLAREIHDLTLTSKRPFIVCSPELLGETLRQPERSAPTAATAAAEAADGTICLLQRMLPEDLVQLLASRTLPTTTARVMVCARSIREVEFFTGAGVVATPPPHRKDDIGQLIAEYERIACAKLYVAEPPLTKEDRAWIRRRAGSLIELHHMVERLVARYAAGSFTAGAALVGMTHRALIKWLDQRGYPRGKNANK